MCLKNISLIKNVINSDSNLRRIWDQQCFSKWLDLQSYEPDGDIVHAFFQLQNPNPVNPEWLGLSYSLPNGIHLTFGPLQYCLVTGFSFGDNNSIINELQNNEDYTSFKRRVIDKHLKKEPDVKELVKFLDDSRHLLESDEDLVKLCALLYVYSFF